MENEGSQTMLHHDPAPHEQTASTLKTQIDWA